MSNSYTVETLLQESFRHLKNGTQRSKDWSRTRKPTPSQLSVRVKGGLTWTRGNRDTRLSGSIYWYVPTPVGVNRSSWTVPTGGSLRPGPWFGPGSLRVEPDTLRRKQGPVTLLDSSKRRSDVPSRCPSRRLCSGPKLFLNTLRSFGEFLVYSKVHW